MYRVVTIKDTIRVPPTQLGKPLEEAVKESIAEVYEGLINERIGVA